ncbi:MAG: hypothetical protein NTW19_07380 [Planctomycetota bacterium]|nr:hypothetical protein [Planctomycetota bacterium]
MRQTRTRSHAGWVHTLAVAAALAAILPPAHARAADADETLQSAVFLLRAAATPSPDGQNTLLLRALRHTGDPELTPFFSEIYQSSTPSLRIHGLLGLAECGPDKKLDLERLASMDKDSGAIQAEIVSAALDAELLSDEQAKQIIAWPGMDSAIKVLASAPLVQHKKLASTDHLKEAAKAENAARRGMANIMLLQMGDAAAMKGLQETVKPDDPKRDQIRQLLLETILRYDFDAAAPWAMQVALDPAAPSRLSLLALRAAMRFGVPGSQEEWRKRYDSNADPASQTRLALLALNLAPYLPAKLFEPLVRSEDSLVKQIGLTGAAVADKKDVAPAVVALVRAYHPLTSAWALSHARKRATDAEASAIFMAIVQAGGEGPDRNRAQRLDDAVLATEFFFERDPKEAVAKIRPVLGDPKTNKELRSSILVGLIAAKGDGAEEALAGLEPMTDQTSRYVALLLQAKPGKPLAPAQMQDLSLLVRGGGQLPPTLRIQAAWTYLKLTHQTREALTAAMSRPS